MPTSRVGNVKTSQCRSESVGRARVTACARDNRRRGVVVDIGPAGEERVDTEPGLRPFEVVEIRPTSTYDFALTPRLAPWMGCASAS